MEKNSFLQTRSLVSGSAGLGERLPFNSLYLKGGTEQCGHGPIA